MRKKHVKQQRPPRTKKPLALVPLVLIAGGLVYLVHRKAKEDARA